MLKIKPTGNLGELDVISKIKCPNCSKELMLLPKNYPLFDIQCTACNFRAQVKTNNTPPKSIIRGAGWDILNKVTKAGFLLPPLIVNFKWKEKGEKKQEIRFYPFIRKGSLKPYLANIKSRNRKYKMFNYDLSELIYSRLYFEYTTRNMPTLQPQKRK